MHWCSAGFQMPRRVCYDLSEPGLRPACLPGAPGRRQDHLRSACSDAPPSSQKTGDLLNLENFVLQIGGGEKDSRGAKGDAPKPFDVRVLLRRVLSRVRQVYLAIGEKLAEVI